VLDPKVFKAYDVRGIYPTDLDEAGAEAIGHAFVEVFKPRPIKAGHDMRTSAPAEILGELYREFVALAA
jgi:phosphomannomutase